MDNLNASGSAQRLFSTTRSVTKRVQQEETKLVTNRFKSPFYEGRTTFGGSSAKISRLATASPYGLNKQASYLTRIKESDIKRADNSIPLSNSAKQILKKMERITSPIQDAKRLSTGGSTLFNTSSLFEPSRPFRRASSSKPNSSANSPFQLNASVTQEQKPLMKWDSPFSANNNTQLKNLNTSANQIEVIDLEQNMNKNEGFGGKIRARVSSSRHHKESELQNSSLPQSELKNVAPLPISSLPTFNFIKNPSQAASESSLTSQSDISTTKRSYEELVSSEYEAEFQFAPPKMLRYALMKIKPKQKPEEVVSKPSAFPTVSGSSTSVSSALSESKSKESNLPSSVKFNQVASSSSVCTPQSEAKQPLAIVKFNTETSKVLDDRSAPINKSPLKASLSMFAAPLNTWECETCLVRNETSAIKCVACETPKVAKKDNNELSKSYTGFDFGKVNTKRDNPSISFAPAESNESKATNSIGSSSLFPGTIGAKENISANLINSKTSLSPVKSATIDLTSKPNDILANKLTSSATSTSSFSALLNKPLDTKSSSTDFKFGSTDSSKVNASTPSDKQSATALPAITSSWGDKFAPPSSSWECSECLVQNKSESTKCISCETPKAGASATEPAKTASTTAPAASAFKFGSGSLSTQFKLPISTSTSEASSSEPPKTDKPAFTFGSTASNTTVAATSGFTFGNKLGGEIKLGSLSKPNETPAEKSTSISTSIFGNKDTNTNSLSSKSEAPSISTSSLFSTTAPLSLSSKFAPPANSWKCNVCEINNKESDNKCAACESPRPGASLDPKPSTASAFKFGSNDKTPAVSSASIFGASSFSANAPAAATATTKSDSIFKFGSGGFSSTPATPATTTTTSSLLTNANNSTVTSNAASTKPNFSFNFSSPATTSSGLTTASAPAFNFGSAISSSTIGSTVTTASSAPAPAFSFSATSKLDAGTNSTTSGPSAPFVFGSTTNSNPITANTPFAINNSQNSVGSTPANSFGGSNAFGTNSTAKFTFGQPSITTPSNNNTLPPPANSNGGFNFDAASTLNGGNVFGAPSQPTVAFSATPTFNFGVDTSNNVFQFAAKTDPSALTTTNTHGRNIKKAKRRLGPTS